MNINELSNIGRHHIDANEDNQDAICHGQNRYFSVISLADGVSTCPEAKSGAEIASKAITNLLLKKGEYFLEFEVEQIAEFALSQILYEVKQRAAQDSKDINDYSSTISSVLVDKKKRKMLSLNLGDSIIMAVENGLCRVIDVPSGNSSGCYVTTTKNVSTMISVKVLDVSLFESIVICSDGAWRHMFIKNKLKPEVATLLLNNEYDGLKEFLIKQNCFDDYSFISLDMGQRNRRKSA